MSKEWDKRYSIKEYRYGEAPNLFFKEIIDIFPAGKILLPADGESRNGVYAAKKGWTVDAFDQSVQAKEKALKLARKNDVNISYKVIDFSNITDNYVADSYDVIALTYVHLPKQLKEKYHKSLLPFLKTGGYIIIEGFSQNHLKYQHKDPLAGGPPLADMMYLKEEIAAIFDSLETILLEEKDIDLSEGTGHNGKASILRFIGKKV